MLLMPTPNSPLARARAQQHDASNSGSDMGSTPAPITLAERLEVVAKRFLHDICSCIAFEDGRPLEQEEVRRAASLYLAPGVIVHVDGLLGCLAPPAVTGHDALFDYLDRERAAYRPAGQRGGPRVSGGGLETLLVAVDEEGDTAFVLSRFRLQNVGEWLGRPPTNRISEGVRIDEIRFDSEAKVVEAWCNRQLFEEEREALLRDPAHHHAARLDPPGEGGEGGGGGEGGHQLLRHRLTDPEVHGPLAPQKMLRVANMWAESWNVATASGSLNPDLLDNLLEPDFAVHDLLGLTGDDSEHLDHPYTAVRSRDDAKRVLAEVTSRYDVDESVVRMAARRGTNAVFTHWRARLLHRTPEAVAAREAAASDPFGVGPGPLVSPVHKAAAAPSSSSSPDPPSFVAEVAELLLLSPAGKLAASFQFRRPLGSDRRRVLLVAPPPASGPDAVPQQQEEEQEQQELELEQQE